MRIEKDLRRLAEAFVRVVVSEGMIEVCYPEIEKLRMFFTRAPSVRQFLFSETIDAETKKEILTENLKNEFSPHIIGLLRTVIDLDYGRKLFRLLAYIEKLIEREEAAYVAEVYSAIPLSKELRKEVERFAKEVTGREVKIREMVDESLIGGLVLRIGDKLYDGSVINRLRRFKKAVS